MRLFSLKFAKLFAVVFTMAALDFSARADGWEYWGAPDSGGLGFWRLANDGTNLYASTLLNGVWRASLADRQFEPMPMAGFPLWEGTTNTNGFAVWNIATTPQGTLVISGSPVNVVSNGITAPPSTFNNTLPVFYWWDETNQLWHAASVTNKSYPYTSGVGDFSVAPDGSLWTCSGFYPYAYRSTDGGHSYTAFDINARVPTNYFPIPITGLTTFGKLFSIVAGPQNEVVVGTETGGYLHTTNNGLNWWSLDPNFIDPNSTNPFGRIGNAIVAGCDHYGNFLCSNFEMIYSPAYTNWYGTNLFAWRPKDGSFRSAVAGLPFGLGFSIVVTPSSGTSFMYMNQNHELQGGVFRSFSGKSWTQFNDGSPLMIPFAPNVPSNAVAAGNHITAVGNIIYIAVGSGIWTYDSTPLPITNRAPVAAAQAANLWQSSATNLTLAGYDADGDPLNFTVTTFPSHGVLSGTPPNVTYTPTNNYVGLDSFWFVADDNRATSAPVLVNLVVNYTTNPPPGISLLSPINGSSAVLPTNILLSAAASDNDGSIRVNFYDGPNFLGAVSNAPFQLVITNPPPGDYVFFARATDKYNARAWAPPVSFSVLPVAPRLSIQPVNATNVAVTWPLDIDGFFLESSTNVDGPWKLSPFPQLYFSNGQTATVPAADHEFFRLTHPR